MNALHELASNTVTAAAPLLTVEGLSVAHGRVQAVQDVSLSVAAGELVTVIGPNGAGKSTLLNALMGTLPSQGRVQFDGRTLRSGDVAGRVACGVALVPEQRALFGSMSVADNLALGGYRWLDEPAARRADTLREVCALFPRLQERRRQRASTLSGGERQMLALGRALMGRPRLLMLDEPSLGLAPLIVAEIFRTIDQLRQRGMAVLLVEQNARAALRLAQRGHVLELGRVVMQGAAQELAQDPRIVEAYLGSGAHAQRVAA